MVDGSSDELSVTEAASQLGITRQSVHERIQAGTLAARKVGHFYVITKEDLMVNLSKAKGTSAESALVKYAREQGFPAADRLALSGANDRGDVRLTKELRAGVIAECKAGNAAHNASDLLIDAWMVQTENERQAAGAALGVLVVKRAGFAGQRCGRWWAILPLGALHMLRMGEPVNVGTQWHGSDALPVRMHLDALMPLLATVYGEDD